MCATIHSIPAPHTPENTSPAPSSCVLAWMAAKEAVASDAASAVRAPDSWAGLVLTPALPNASRRDEPCAPPGNLFMPLGSACARGSRALVVPGIACHWAVPHAPMCAVGAHVLCSAHLPWILRDSWRCDLASPWAISCACQAAVCVSGLFFGCFWGLIGGFMRVDSGSIAPMGFCLFACGERECTNCPL